MTAIEEKYDSLGGPNGILGNPVSNEKPLVPVAGNKSPRFQDYENGSIYWHPDVGAFEVHGLIRKKWLQLGGWTSKLGFPKTDETDTEGGRYNLFQRGVILWKSGAPEAYEVRGAIHRRYTLFGSEKGKMGFPTTDERGTPDGLGRYNHFENGYSIYYKDTVGAHEVHGLIRNYWESQGWEESPKFGYPISNETIVETLARSNWDTYSDFENGVIFWNYGSKAAEERPPNALLSRSGSEVYEELAKRIEDALVPAPEDVIARNAPAVYITKAPYPAGIRSAPFRGGSDSYNFYAITDYQQTNDGVRNRQYQIRVEFAVSVDNTNDPDFRLSLTFEFRYDRDSRAIQAVVRGWHLHTEVDWPTNWFVTAEEVSSFVKEELDDIVDEPIDIFNVPTMWYVLSAKVMPNGDFNVYTV